MGLLEIIQFLNGYIEGWTKGFILFVWMVLGNFHCFFGFWVKFLIIPDVFPIRLMYPIISYLIDFNYIPTVPSVETKEKIIVEDHFFEYLYNFFSTCGYAFQYYILTIIASHMFCHTLLVGACLWMAHADNLYYIFMLITSPEVSFNLIQQAGSQTWAYLSLYCLHVYSWFVVTLTDPSYETVWDFVYRFRYYTDLLELHTQQQYDSTIYNTNLIFWFVVSTSFIFIISNFF